MSLQKPKYSNVLVTCTSLKTAIEPQRTINVLKRSQACSCGETTGGGKFWSVLNRSSRSTRLFGSVVARKMRNTRQRGPCWCDPTMRCMHDTILGQTVTRAERTSSVVQERLFLSEIRINLAKCRLALRERES